MEKLIKRLIKQEMLLHDIWFASDSSVVKRLLHPTFKEVSESGKSHDFNDLVILKVDANIAVETIHSQEYECMLLGDSSALLLYKSATLKATGEYVAFAKRVSIWVDTDVGWQMKYHQGTTCEAFDIIELT